MQDMSRRN